MFSSRLSGDVYQNGVRQIDGYEGQDKPVLICITTSLVGDTSRDRELKFKGLRLRSHISCPSRHGKHEHRFDGSFQHC